MEANEKIKLVSTIAGEMLTSLMEKVQHINAVDWDQISEACVTRALKLVNETEKRIKG